MTPDEQRAAFEAQEAARRTLEFKVPREWNQPRATAALMALTRGEISGDAATLLNAVASGLDRIAARCTRCGGELGWDPGMGVWLTQQPMGGWSDQCPAGTTNRYHQPPALTEDDRAALRRR